MKRIKVISLLVLIVVLTTCLFVACKKKDTPQTPPEPEFTGVKVYFLNEVINSEDIALSDAVEVIEFEYDAIKDADEGLITLLDLQNKSYNKVSGNIYNILNNVALSETEAQAGDIRIRLFTSVESDKITTDTASIVRIDGHTLTQTGKMPEQLTLEEGTYIFVAKMHI